jgi:hypothetical protein
MRNVVRTTRPQRRPSAARQIPRRAAVTRTVPRFARPVIRHYEPPALDLAILAAVDEAGPYLDYARRLTSEGGIRITYKDLDLRWRYIIARILLWGAYSGLEAWLLIGNSPVENTLINYACLLVMAPLNLFMVWKLPEIHRSVEIRPDCMVLDQGDVFRLRLMESLPAFKSDESKNLILSGVYGTRYVEYLIARRFDEYDRMPEVFAAHLKDAIRQLWENPTVSSTREDQ